MPLAAGPGAHSQPRWSPDGAGSPISRPPRAAAAALRALDGERRGGADHRPSRYAVSLAWSPDGRQIAYTMFVPGEGMKLGRAADKPEGAQWAEPLRSITAVTYRTDEEGYLKPGFSHIFLVAADGGAPRQLSFGSVHDNGPLELDRPTAARSCSAATARPTGSASRSTAKSMRSTSRRARSAR
jgi:hypothetical protein